MAKKMMILEGAAMDINTGWPQKIEEALKLDDVAYVPKRDLTDGVQSVYDTFATYFSDDFSPRGAHFWALVKVYEQGVRDGIRKERARRKKQKPAA